VIGVLVFLLGLPLAVYTWSGLFLFIDQPSLVHALVRLSFRLVLVAGLIFLTPAGSRIWIGVAFLLVALLHAGAQRLIRYAIRTDRWLTARIE